METARGKRRLNAESEMIRRREKEFQHDQMWGGASKYYDHFNQVNTKFEDWTSPRYYTESMKQYEELKSRREKEKHLDKRREALQKLYEEEARSFEIEMMVQKNKPPSPIRSKADDIPLELLQNVHDSFKQAEENKRKQEAESKLYQQWRMNNPVVRSYERAYNNRNVKLSWLDQQIEKRMRQEKEEEEAKRILKEREENIQKQKQLEEQHKRETEEKNRMYKEMLDIQVEELKKKQACAEELKRLEQKETKRKLCLAEIAAQQQQEERRRMEREVALFNVRQHKLKLKQKAKDIQENLAMEKDMIQRLQQLEYEKLIEDERKRCEVRESFEKYMKLVKVQQELERDRERTLDFIFDSEAKGMFDRQSEIWRNEEEARQGLLKEVLATLKEQVEANIRRNREYQAELLKEREENTMRIEMYNEELERLKEEDEKKKANRRQELDESVKVKQARKVAQDGIKLKELDDELDRIRKEEERLKREIMNIQKRQGNVRPTSTTRLFYWKYLLLDFRL